MTVPVESCPEGEYIYLQRESKLPGLSDMLRKFAVDVPQKNIPVLSMLFEPGVMFWALFLYIAICIYCKKYKWSCPAFLGIGFWITLLLGPAVLVRYAYPLFTMLPLELAVILTQFRKTPAANAIEPVQE